MTQVQYPVIATTLTKSVEQLENKNRQMELHFLPLASFMILLVVSWWHFMEQ